MNLFFSIHYPHHLKRFDKFHRSGSPVDAEATVEGFQAFISRRFFPWLKTVQHLLCIEAFALQLSVSGTVLQLMQDFNPGALQALKELSANRKVSFVENTFYHSMASLFSSEEHEAQLQLHRCCIENLFEKSPVPFTTSAACQFLNKTLYALAQKLYSLEKNIKAQGDEKLLHQWRLLQDKQLFTPSFEALLKRHLTELEVLLLQKKLSAFRPRFPQHSFYYKQTKQWKIN